MQHIMQWIFKFLFVGLLSAALLGCSLLSTEEKTNSGAPMQKVFFAPFDEVWRAAQLSLTSYPMRVNNVDLGILETDYIKGSEGWQPPGDSTLPSGGMRYKITVRILKGKYRGHSSVKVTILKRAEIQRDFFSPVEKLPSDGLEELSIMYRVQRELALEQLLRASQKKANNAVKEENTSNE